MKSSNFLRKDLDLATAFHQNISISYTGIRKALNDGNYDRVERLLNEMYSYNTRIKELNAEKNRLSQKVVMFRC